MLFLDKRGVCDETGVLIFLPPAEEFMARFSRSERKLITGNCRPKLRRRRLAFERCEPRQMLATDLAWVVPQDGVRNGVAIDAAGNVYTVGEGALQKVSPSGALV